MEAPLRAAAELGGDACDQQQQPYTTDARRWYVLFFFALYSFNQCYTWFTFASSGLDTMQGYFGPDMSKGVVDMLLNWGPLGGVAAFLPQTWIMSRRGGLRRGVWLGMLLTLAGNLLRTVPIIIAEISGERRYAQGGAAFAFYHAGQLLNALSGPFCMGACTLLSCVWFGEGERNTATAVAQMANGLGTVVGFLNPMLLIPKPGSVPAAFYFGIAIAAAPCCCALLYFPARPPRFPSAAARAMASVGHWQQPEGASPDCAAGSGVRLAAGTSSPLTCGGASFMVLMLAVGLNSGVLIGWQGCLQSILNPAGISDRAVGYIGFSNGLAQIVAGVITGSLADSWFQRKLKVIILVGMLGQFLALTLLTLSLPCSAYDTAPLGHTELSLIVLVSWAGLFFGAIYPLCFELAAELLHPRKESTSAGILVLLLNASSLVMIQLNSQLTPSSMNLITVAVLGAVFLLVAAVREEYRRPRDRAPT